MTIAIGSRIEATRPADSFYKRVRGVVVKITDGWVKIDADEVVSKWGNTWEKHPSSCRMDVKISDIAI